MGKILFTYGGFTAAQLKSRASIPYQGDIAAGVNYIDCSSIDIPTEIRDTIGEGSNDLGTIYLSAKVNQWSNFSPREWYISGGQFLNRVKALPYDMANFCGYNHNATPPMVGQRTINASVYNYPDIFSVSVFVYSSEINWPAVNSEITKLWCTVYDDLTPVGSGCIDINTLMDGNQRQILITSVPFNQDRSKTFNCKLYFGKNTGELIAYFPAENTWNIVITSYYNVVLAFTMSQGTQGIGWPETTPFIKNSGSSVSKAYTDYVLNFEITRIGRPFTGNITGSFRVWHYNGGSTLLGQYSIPGNITTSASGMQNSLHFYKSGNLHNDISGFPSSLNWGDNLYFYFDRTSGGF